MDVRIGRRHGRFPIPMVRLHTRITIPAHLALTRMLERGIIQGSVGRWLSDIILDISETYEEQAQEQAQQRKEISNNEQPTE
jgi:hypothetical protein